MFNPFTKLLLVFGVSLVGFVDYYGEGNVYLWVLSVLFFVDKIEILGFFGELSIIAPVDGWLKWGWGHGCLRS